MTSCGSCVRLLPTSRTQCAQHVKGSRRSSCQRASRRRWWAPSSQEVAIPLRCSSAPRQHCAKHHCCHHQPRRALRQRHGSHCSVKSALHSSLAMEALESTRMAAEVDPDPISKIRARSDTRNRRAQPPSGVDREGWPGLSFEVKLPDQLPHERTSPALYCMP